MTNIDIQMMLSLLIAPPDLVPTVRNVWREVYDGFSQSVVGDDILIYIACHGGRVAKILCLTTLVMWNHWIYIELVEDQLHEMTKSNIELFKNVYSIVN
jgi:hypothetical protein